MLYATNFNKTYNNNEQLFTLYCLKYNCLDILPWMHDYIIYLTRKIMSLLNRLLLVIILVF